MNSRFESLLAILAAGGMLGTAARLLLRLPMRQNWRDTQSEENRKFFLDHADAKRRRKFQRDVVNFIKMARHSGSSSMNPVIKDNIGGSITCSKKS